MNYALSDLFPYKVYISDKMTTALELCEIASIDKLSFGVLNKKGPSSIIKEKEV